MTMGAKQAIKLCHLDERTFGKKNIDMTSGETQASPFVISSKELYKKAKYGDDIWRYAG